MPPSPGRRRLAVLAVCAIAGVAVLLGAPAWAAVVGVIAAAFALGVRPGRNTGGDDNTGGLYSSDVSGDAGAGSDGGSA